MNIKQEVFLERKILEEKTLYAISIARKYFGEAEITFNSFYEIDVQTRFGEREKIEFKKNNTFFIKLYHKKSQGCASSTNLSLQSIKKTIKAAFDIAKKSSKDFCFGISDSKFLAYEPLDLNLFYPFEINVNKFIEYAAEAEMTALNTDKNIQNTEGGNFNSSYGIKVFANTANMLKSYCWSRHILSTCVIAKNKNSMERDYSYTVGRCIKDLSSPLNVGKDAAKRVLSRLSPKKIFTMKKVSTIFASNTAVSLFKHLANAISGVNIYQKSSFLLNSLNKKILPSWLTIYENPHLIKGLNSAPFDNEGVKTQKRNIIENGILKTWLLKNYESRKLGLDTTGHAGGIYNWLFFVKEKNIDFNSLLQEMKNGLLITELIGQGVNLVTGDYSRGAFGFWVQNGKIKYPVSEIIISGNLKKMWSNMIMMSNDIDTRENIQCGSFLLKNMYVAGE